MEILGRSLMKYSDEADEKNKRLQKICSEDYQKIRKGLQRIIQMISRR